MEQRERLKEAMDIIKNYCYGRNCLNCLFFKDEFCHLICVNPNQWDTSKLIPSLNEDEKAILRSLDKHFIIIFRDNDGDLFVKNQSAGLDFCINIFPNLFDFIKNNEKYTISELLKND